MSHPAYIPGRHRAREYESVELHRHQRQGFEKCCTVRFAPPCRPDTAHQVTSHEDSWGPAKKLGRDTTAQRHDIDIRSASVICGMMTDSQVSAIKADHMIVVVLVCEIGRNLRDLARSQIEVIEQTIAIEDQGLVVRRPVGGLQRIVDGINNSAVPRLDVQDLQLTTNVILVGAK